MQYAALILYSYLLGAIPSAYVIGRFKGKDITNEGSGNIGGTNAYRVLGAKLGILVALMDLGKVLTALIITRIWLGHDQAMVLSALAAVIGHNWSVYVRFRGGKGIAVSIGTYVFLFPGLALLALAGAILNILITKYVSLGSLMFMLIMALLLIVSDYSLWYKGLGLILLVIAIYRHRTNITALRAGTERRFGQK